MSRSGMSMNVTRLSDYRCSAFMIVRARFEFDLHERATEVMSELHIVRNEAAQGDAREESLRLDGEDLQLLEVRLDGRLLSESDYCVSDTHLEIADVSDAFVLRVRTRISPAENTRLEGLYLSNGIYCTQCEAEGFRRITYFLDRPDVMSVYDVVISAPLDFTAVLSNGNLVSDEVRGDRRICHWHDPHPKPCYLFALVAGRLGCIRDSFRTREGRDVSLCIYLREGYESRGAYAMGALKRAMRWDEERFGLCYDLDLFNIVAIEDFNMGAMENKSLNIFNAKYVLADSETATDSDYLFIDRIIGHEYFHNWSGNRVTCRDWFQLSLKEGLTVFRDQEYIADEYSRSHIRILDVMRLRDSQFPEDAGPLSHAVRPAAYVEINNFYTATVYEKGAEVVRLLHSYLGERGFCAGLSLYFDRFDGQAVTCDDFLATMRAANGVDLQGFELWYSQSGTPRIRYDESYDAESGEYRLQISQRTLPTADSKVKEPLRLPLRFALLGAKGELLSWQAPADSELLRVDSDDYFDLRSASHSYIFRGLSERPQLSLNRGFSAPVIIETCPSEEKLAFHMSYDDDSYVRWDSFRNYSLLLLRRLIDDGTDNVDSYGLYFEALGEILRHARDDTAYSALLLQLPSETTIAEHCERVNVAAIHRAREHLLAVIARSFGADFRCLYDDLRATEPYTPSWSEMGRRALRNLSLVYLSALGAEDGGVDDAFVGEQYLAADNMTDKIAAMRILADSSGAVRDRVFGDFYDRFKGDGIVLDKWFSLQAGSHAADALSVIYSLSEHKDFSIENPNRLRSLVGSFAFGNSLKFHSADGLGYDFVLSLLGRVDGLNPQSCARLLGSFSFCDRLCEPQRSLAKEKLGAFADSVALSRDSLEIIGKILGRE